MPRQSRPGGETVQTASFSALSAVPFCALCAHRAICHDCIAPSHHDCIAIKNLDMFGTQFELSKQEAEQAREVADDMRQRTEEELAAQQAENRRQAEALAQSQQ